MREDRFVVPSWVSYQKSKKMFYLYDSKNKKEYCFKDSSYLIMDYFTSRENEKIDSIINCFLEYLSKIIENFDHKKIQRDIEDFIRSIYSKGLCINKSKKN